MKNFINNYWIYFTSLAIIIICIFGYNYAKNYVIGNLELSWLKNGVVSNWNFRLVFLLVIGGGLGGFITNFLVHRKAKENIIFGMLQIKSGKVYLRRDKDNIDKM